MIGTFTLDLLQFNELKVPEWVQGGIPYVWMVVQSF